MSKHLAPPPCPGLCPLANLPYQNENCTICGSLYGCFDNDSFFLLLYYARYVPHRGYCRTWCPFEDMFRTTLRYGSVASVVLGTREATIIAVLDYLCKVLLVGPLCVLFHIIVPSPYWKT